MYIVGMQSQQQGGIKDRGEKRQGPRILLESPNKKNDNKQREKGEAEKSRVFDPEKEE